jgi:hypothetical protein
MRWTVGVFCLALPTLAMAQEGQSWPRPPASAHPAAAKKGYAPFRQPGGLSTLVAGGADGQRTTLRYEEWGDYVDLPIDSIHNGQPTNRLNGGSLRKGEH